jgi:hypothetical protein
LDNECPFEVIFGDLREGDPIQSFSFTSLKEGSVLIVSGENGLEIFGCSWWPRWGVLGAGGYSYADHLNN